MKQKISSVFYLAPLLLMVGCGDLDAPSNETVIGGALVVDFSASMMKQSLIDEGIADENSTVFGYKAYKVPYTTTDEAGDEVAVSGLFILPTGMPPAVEQIGLSVVSDDHGTIFANIEAPTVIAENNGVPDGAPILLTSLGGFVTLQPDYIGFGDSVDHDHPFILKKSLASSTVDFIKAAQKFAQDNNIKLNQQLFLTGYSEGGYAALATLEAIESQGELSVALTAPMAGPYDLNVTAFGVLSNPELSVPSFMAEIGYAYANAYAKELTTIINEPYASKLPTLFDGRYTREQIDPELTTKTTGDDGLFNPVFVQNFFADPHDWFREAMVTNSVHAWAPQTPIRLVQCQGDEVIPYAISEITQKSMIARGAQSVELIPVEATLGLEQNLSHGECGSFAYGIVTQIFSSYRKATIGY